MNCETARDLMLEADLADLSPAGSTALALHLGGCAACRALAERIVAESQSLAHALQAMRPPLELEAARRRAVAAAARIRSRRRVLRRAGLVTPFALAAGVGALLLRGERGAGPPPPPSSPAARTGLDVQAPAGVNVAVFQTDNPQIVVIWHYGAAQ